MSLRDPQINDWPVYVSLSFFCRLLHSLYIYVGGRERTRETDGQSISSFIYFYFLLYTGPLSSLCSLSIVAQLKENEIKEELMCAYTLFFSLDYGPAISSLITFSFSCAGP